MAKMWPAGMRVTTASGSVDGVLVDECDPSAHMFAEVLWDNPDGAPYREGTPVREVVPAAA